jgi:DNA-binding transcriptional LysR family regulator
VRGSEFSELRVFAAVATQRSFSRAARNLGMSSSSVSQVVRELEGRIGLQLLNRTTRSVVPTEAGLRLLTRLTPVLDELNAMLMDLSELRDDPSGIVRLLTPRLAFTDVIEPLLGQFAQTYPEIVLNITVDDSIVDLVASGFDVGIRLGEFLDADVVGIPISDRLRQIPVASPAYVLEFGKPLHPRDLHAHRCINWHQQGAHGLYHWEFEKQGQKLAVAVDGPVILNDRSLAVAAALQGAGIAMWVEHRLAPLIAKKKLVALLEDWCPTFPGFFAYFSKHKNMPFAQRVFVDFLRDRTRRSHVDS